MKRGVELVAGLAILVLLAFFPGGVRAGDLPRQLTGCNNLKDQVNYLTKSNGYANPQFATDAVSVTDVPHCAYVPSLRKVVAILQFKSFSTTLNPAYYTPYFEWLRPQNTGGLTVFNPIPSSITRCSNTGVPFPGGDNDVTKNWTCSSHYPYYANDGTTPPWNEQAWFAFSVPAPNVNLQVSPNNIPQGGKATLTWTSQDAVKVEIDNGIGSVTVPNGSKEVTNIQATTKYTATATNAQGVTATSSTTVTIPPPDLAVDLSQVKYMQNGKEVPEVDLDNRYQAFSIQGIRVSNIGKSDASATQAELNFSLPGAKDLNLTSGLLVPAIASGKTAVLTSFTVSSEVIQRMDENGFFTGQSGSDTSVNTGDLTVKIQAVDSEINRSNNTDAKAKFLHWSTLRVFVRAQDPISKEDKSVEDVRVIATSANNKVSKQLTDSSGQVEFALLDPPSPTNKYDIAVTYRGVDGLAKTSVVVGTYEVFSVNLLMPTATLSSVTAIPQLLAESQPNSYTDNDYGKPTNGTAIARTDKGELLTAQLVDGSFTFHGDYNSLSLTSINLRVAFQLGNVFKQAYEYKWDLKENNTYGPSTIDLAGGENKVVKIKLPKECKEQSTGVKLCFYLDQVSIDNAQTQYVPIANFVMNRLEHFDPSVRLTTIKEIWFVPFDPGGGRFAYDAPTLLWISDGFLRNEPIIAEDILTHESMHAIDYQIGTTDPAYSGNKYSPFFSFDETRYVASASLTAYGNTSGLVTSKTGVWAWGHVGTTCALMPNTVQASHCTSHYDPADGSLEIFAEEATNVCLHLPISRALSDAQNKWLTDPNKVGQPVPDDLIYHTNIIASRSIGSSPLPIGTVISNYDPYEYGALSYIPNLINSCQNTPSYSGN